VINEADAEDYDKRFKYPSGATLINSLLSMSLSISNSGYVISNS